MAYQQGPVGIAPCFLRWGFLDHLRAGRVPDTWRKHLADDPMMRSVVMVFDLAIGGAAGKMFRVASVPVRSISGKTGRRHDAFPGIIEEPGISSNYSLGDASSSSRQISLTLDAALVEPMKIIRAGGILSGIVEVSLERADIENDYDRRYVLLRGSMRGVSFGAVRKGRGGSRPDDREIITLQIVDPRESASSKLPPFVLDTGRIDLLPDSSVGATYPMIFNSGFRVPAPRTTSNDVGSNSFAVAYGTVSVVPAFGSVFINGVAAFGGTDAWVAEQREDLDGTPYTRVRFTDVARAWEPSDAVHVTSEARILDRQEGPVEVIRRVVEHHSTMGIQGANPELFATASAKYPSGLGKPRIAINASGGSAATVLDWIENGFLASFPMLSMVWSGGGYGPILTDSRSNAVASLTAGSQPLLDRASLVAESDQIFNEFVIRYGYDPMQDVWAGVVIRSPTNSSLCDASRALVGRRDATPLDSVYIADAASAGYVADWLVQHFAVPSYTVEYDASPQVFLLYQRGDTIKLTDAEFGWVDEPATVEGISYTRGKCVVTLRVWLRYLNVGGGALSRPVGT